MGVEGDDDPFDQVMFDATMSAFEGVHEAHEVEILTECDWELGERNASCIKET